MHTARRDQSGFSLPTMCVLSVIAGLWMLATAALVVPSMGRIASEHARDVARSSAEASLDWGIQQLNNPASRITLDGQNCVSVPASLMGDSNYQGSLTVRNISPPVDSYLYDPQIDPTQPNSTIQGGNGWRVLTANVTAPNGVSRSVRVILKPNYRVTNQPGAPISQVVDGDPAPMFANAAFSNMSLNGTGNLVTNSYDSANGANPIKYDDKDGDIGSNTGITLKGNSHIGGNGNVFSKPGGTNVVATGAPNVTVSGNLNINGAASNFPALDPSHINQYLTNDPVKLAPVPGAPSGSADLGSTLNMAGNNVVSLSAKQARLPDGTMVATSSGSFVVNSVAISGNAKITVDPSYGPVNLYVQGSGSNAGIALTGNSVTGVARPGDFRIWYAGGGPTKIAGNGNFRGVIYAPNSDFSQTGNGTLYGAIIANSITFGGNATFHFDVALKRAQDLMYIPKITRQAPGPEVSAQYVNYYQAVTWDEL